MVGGVASFQEAGMVGTDGRSGMSPVVDRSTGGRGDSVADAPVCWAVRAGEEIARSRGGGTGPVVAVADGAAGSGGGPAGAAGNPDAWPAQAELVLSALEAGQFGPVRAGAAANRRALPRRPYRVRAALRLFSDADQTPPRPLFTRDIHARGLGFITPHRLPLGHGGVVELPTADGGRTVTVACTLLRCREAAPGWFEGSLYFNRDQPEFVG